MCMRLKPRRASFTMGRQRLIQAQGSYLPFRFAGIAEARNRVALKRGLLPQIMLRGIVAVQSQVAAEVVADVCGSLVDIDRGGGGAKEFRTGGSLAVGIKARIDWLVALPPAVTVARCAPSRRWCSE